MFWKKKSPIFADFIAMTAELVKSSQLLKELFESDPAKQRVLVDELKQHEHKADLIAHSLFQRLHQTFIHPFEHDDIILFTKALDNVVDSMYHIGEFCTHIYAIEKVRVEAHEFANILEECCLYLERIANLLSDTEKHKKTLEQYWIAIHKLENQADLLLRQAIRKLFLELEMQKIPVSLYCAWQELFRMLESATDCAEECAHVTEQLTMKYS